MVVLTKGSTGSIVVTLDELKTLASPYYLFTFRNMTTEEVVSFVLNSTADLSQYKYRYNKFNITVNTYFANTPEGFWYYKIYEQSSSSNTDTSLATGLVEEGYMKLKPATTYAPTEHSMSNTYTVYEGS